MLRIIRRVFERSRYRRGMTTTLTPLSEVLAAVPGRWVAVDRRTNEMRAVAASPYELAAKIRELHLEGVAVVRAPDPQEPELVGLG